MNITMIGTGYVGLVTGTCFAEMGNDVLCYDIDEAKIAMLQNGVVPIYEPGLKELVEKNINANRLNFSTDFKRVVDHALVLFICVGTPCDETGHADTSNVLSVAHNIGRAMEEYKIVVVKSTCPPGTCQKVSDQIWKALDTRGKSISLEVDIVSNPEFLKEGDAIKDFTFPDRVVIGTDNIRTAELMRTLYGSFMRERDKIILMDVTSAELTKYASNAMLATRISFMNELSRYAEKVGADIEMVRRGVGADSRIGPRFLYPGLGYGGSCFPKDVKALMTSMNENNVPSLLLDAVEQINEEQREWFYEKIRNYYGVFFEENENLVAAVWGLAFKPKTDDVRESPALSIITELLKAGIKVIAYDPEATTNAAKELAPVRGDGNLLFAKTPYAALKGADFLILVTEWAEFRNPDFEKMKSLMKSPVIFDGRNQYNPKEMARLGFEYFCIGRKYEKARPSNR